jgi:hypothetical protein
MHSMAMDNVRAAAGQKTKASEQEALLEAIEERLTGTGGLFLSRRSVLDGFDVEDIWTMKISDFKE